MPPPPDAKPEKGPVDAAAANAVSDAKPRKAKSTTRSAKRALKREVERLRRFFDE